MEHWEVDDVKDRIWHVQVTEKHNEKTMVCQLVEISMTLLVILY